MEKTNRVNKIRKKITIAQVLVLAFLLLYTVVLLTPLFWGITASLNEDMIVLEMKMFGFPDDPYFENYTNAFQTLYIEMTEFERLPAYLDELMLNSLLYAVVSAIVSTTTIYVVAYARSRFNFAFLKVLDIIVLVTMALPIVGSLPSQIMIFKKLRLIDNFIGMTVIAKMNFLGMYYFVVATAIRGIPMAFSEAAEIDGASELQVMLRVIFPLTFSIYFTIFIINFINMWNDWQTPYIFLSNFPTATYALWVFKDKTTFELPQKLAGCILVVLPILLIFVIFHKRLMGGISLSEGVKE